MAMLVMLARRTVSLAAAAALAVGRLGNSAALADAPNPSSRAEIVALLSDSIRSLSLQSSASDPRYFSGGGWSSGLDDCFPGNVGPGVAAAAAAGATGDKLGAAPGVQTLPQGTSAPRPAGR